LHVIVIISFLILVTTGMPLKFYYAGWAKHVVHALGGVEATSRLHRFGAVLTFLYFGLHLSSIARGFWRRRAELRNPDTGRFNPLRIVGMLFGPDMPAPHWRDVKDLWAHQKWFFGRGPRPQFDRWTYWEKFDYLAVFWGVGVIGLSGLVLWFPEFFTRLLPGWSINIATIVHSDEALLAAGFIFTFHFFNVHFRIEKFPIDSVIFSGRISRTEMLHERRKWFDRLEASGKLEDLRVKDEWEQWKKVVHPLGFLAFGIGLVLLGLILYATLARLVSGGH
jgi:cytochrome b subunit of formate dehydrogenase